MQDVHSRKRPHLGDSEPLPSKKRAVSVNGTTVLVNGSVLPPAAVDEEPRDQDNLEVVSMPSSFEFPFLTQFAAPFQQFRKEAIFRRMRHYSRENERSQARISELEHLKSTYEASLAVMGACWTQVREAYRSFTGCSDISSKLIDTIRAHVKPDLSPPSDDDVEGMLCVWISWRHLCLLHEDLFCLSKCISSKDNPTLAAAFEEKARSTHRLVAAFVQLNGNNTLEDEIYRRYQRSQTEVCLLHLSNTT